MIEKETIIKLAEEKLSEGMFLVDVLVSSTNVINVYVDSMEGISIDECIQISRNIEGNWIGKWKILNYMFLRQGLKNHLKFFSNTLKMLEKRLLLY